MSAERELRKKRRFKRGYQVESRLRAVNSSRCMRQETLPQQDGLGGILRSRTKLGDMSPILCADEGSMSQGAVDLHSTCWLSGTWIRYVDSISQI
ncbi:hypothetical protein [Paracoccus sp. SCSIO 75233]|uniref:hypothetical protein n=1 Tax=Paracoccus sp. SCSIO 75233 TaxID=3017782 RepID=UPI0022F111C7|nr:hypothetical protein [Paracoccus sp. SCSIO 75233]WBU54312.1 hypothetical protein PAF12_05620 [Paracoccus sp. SCSIO 75233]